MYFLFLTFFMLFFWEAVSFVLMGLECVNHVVLFVFMGFGMYRFPTM